MRTTSPIARLFGKSPITPLQEHMKIVEACAAEVTLLFEALVAGERQRIDGHKQRVDQLENEADESKNGIRGQLPKSLFMPIDRRDFLDMLNAQDSIADTAQDIAGLLSLRHLEPPPTMAGLLVPYVVRNVDAVRQCRRIINELDELLESGFGGREAERVAAMIDELSRIETETDRQEMALVRELFAYEDNLKPIDVVFWYELLRLIGDLADYAEDVGDRLRLFIAR